MQRRALLLAGVLVLIVAAVAATAIGWSGGATPRVPKQPLRVVGASLTPRAHAFGDEVQASVDVVLDRERVDPADVRFVPDFTPYQQAAPLEVSRRDLGRVVQLHYEVPLNCLILRCVPRSEPAIEVTRSFRLTPARILYRVGETQRRASVRWPELHVVTQLTAEELPHAGEPIGPRVEAIPVLDEPTYRVSPKLLQALLFALGFLLAAVAVMALRPYLRREEPAAPAPEPKPAGPELTPLQRALAGLQWARAYGAPREQRKALELLAEELDQADEDELAEEARALAWSPAPPGGQQMEGLAARVEPVAELERDAVTA
jgi:hypothetical protein